MNINWAMPLAIRLTDDFLFIYWRDRRSRDGSDFLHRKKNSGKKSPNKNEINEKQRKLHTKNSTKWIRLLLILYLFKLLLSFDEWTHVINVLCVQRKSSFFFSFLFLLYLWCLLWLIIIPFCFHNFSYRIRQRNRENKIDKKKLGAEIW